MVMRPWILALVSLPSYGAAQKDCAGGLCQENEVDTVGLLQQKQIRSHGAEASDLDFKPPHPTTTAETKTTVTTTTTAIKPAEPCVKTPDDYKDCWDARKVCCVDPSAGLFGSVMAYHAKAKDTAKDSIYFPHTRNFTWAGSSHDLETALKLRAKYGDSDMTTYGIEVAVGFNPILASFGDVVDGYGFQWIVYQAQGRYTKKNQIFAPTFAEWFNRFTEETGEAFDYGVVKDILVAYNTLGPEEDVVDAWTKLTGCSRKCSAPDIGASITVNQTCGCHDDVLDVYSELDKYSQTHSSFDCIKKLFDITNGKPTAGQVRASFAACEDMLPVFTGFGLGYNPLVSPLHDWDKEACKSKPKDRLSGREFVMPNDNVGKLAKKGFQTFPMKAMQVDDNGTVILPKTATSEFC